MGRPFSVQYDFFMKSHWLNLMCTAFIFVHIKIQQSRHAVFCHANNFVFKNGGFRATTFSLKCEWVFAELQGADKLDVEEDELLKEQNNNSLTDEELQQLIDANTAQNTKNKTKFNIWYRWWEEMENRKMLDWTPNWRISSSK